MSNDNRLRAALDKQREGNIDEARELYLQILEDDPQHYFANTILGILHIDRGDLQNAEPYVKKAALLDQDKPLTQIALGSFNKLKGDFDTAIRHYHQAMQRGPQLFEPYYSIGNILLQRNHHLEVAEDYLRKAVGINSGHAGACFDLANVLVQRDNTNKEAISYFRKAIELNRQFDTEATHFMIAAIEGNTPAAPPREYVEHLFDHYAKEFEHHITEVVGYDAPTQLRKLFAEKARFENVLDLGCGTGLCAQAFRGTAKHIIGLDISVQMIEETRKKDLYDELYVSDLNDYLEATNQKFDLVIAADVFIYVGALDRMFKNIFHAALPGADFVFSVEKLVGTGYRLMPSARYAHSHDYIKNLATENGFSIKVKKDIKLRKHHEEWIEGELYKLVKSPQYS